ncbi:hypothetical protein PVK06_023905 [Gossypium arboreum]|uniref:Uncharacterized protein n=1 Tax=Gossypium arboreum TaxID=29729 RepID=A0ABR0PCM0_GOSAR|nr:hypothetical protein PVK06_023905 [Gossypium arboreum]
MEEFTTNNAPTLTSLVAGILQECFCGRKHCSSTCRLEVVKSRQQQKEASTF